MARTFTAASSQYLSITSALVSAVPVTFACWYNPVNTTGTQSMMSICNTSAINYFLLDTTTAKIRAGVRVGGTFVSATSVASITVGSWNHCVAVFASATSRLVYLNNVSASNATNMNPTGMNKSAIGTLYSGSTTAVNFANGQIAFPAIWNVALTASDVAQLFAKASPRLVQPDNLVAYSRLTGGLSTEPDLLLGSGWTLTGASTESVNPLIAMP